MKHPSWLKSLSNIIEYTQTQDDVLWGSVGEPKNGKELKKGGLREHRWREVARGRVT